MSAPLTDHPNSSEYQRAIEDAAEIVQSAIDEADRHNAAHPCEGYAFQSIALTDARNAIRALSAPSPVPVEGEKAEPWGWVCDGKGDGWEECGVIHRDADYVAELRARPNGGWICTPLYLGAAPQPKADAGDRETAERIVADIEREHFDGRFMFASRKPYEAIVSGIASALSLARKSVPQSPAKGKAEAVRCRRCNDTGMIAIRARDGAYAFPGPVPDDAKGYADADCWYCDSGRPRGFEGYGPIGDD